MFPPIMKTKVPDERTTTKKKKGEKGKFRTIEIRENQRLSARAFLPAALFMKTSHASVPSLRAATSTAAGGCGDSDGRRRGRAGCAATARASLPTSPLTSRPRTSSSFPGEVSVVILPPATPGECTLDGALQLQCKTVHSFLSPDPRGSRKPR